MMQYRWEPLNYLLSTGLADLGERSWNEVGYNNLPFDPDWHRYQCMENDNILRFFAVRDESNLLIGYASVIIISNLHSKKVFHAVIQDIYLEPEHRKGYAAFREFINKLEEQFHLINVKFYTIEEPENDPRGNVGIVYERLGFELSGRLWTKELKK